MFAGYGITAPEYDYDDYAGIDVKGKIVMLLRHEPQEFDEKSVFGGKVYTNHAQFESKAVNAKLQEIQTYVVAKSIPPTALLKMAKFGVAVDGWDAPT